MYFKLYLIQCILVFYLLSTEAALIFQVLLQIKSQQN